jgi:shikimate dehydrogenase
MTEKYAVIGSPINHSKSPVIHSAIFKHLGIAADYGSHEVSDLAGFLLQKNDLLGLSVTMPLKGQAFELANELDFWAQRTEAVNTLKRTETGWSGFNTDVFGLQQAAKSVNFQTVAVLGTGATAKSALVAFQDSDLVLWGRNKELVAKLAGDFDSPSVDLQKALSADLVVSTLPAQALSELIPKDSQYRGTLLSAAYAPGSDLAAVYFQSFISGLEMLMWQAVGQQRIFSGLGPSAPMRDEDNLIEGIRQALDMTK